MLPNCEGTWGVDIGKQTACNTLVFLLAAVQCETACWSIGSVGNDQCRSLLCFLEAPILGHLEMEQTLLASARCMRKYLVCSASELHWSSITKWDHYLINVFLCTMLKCATNIHKTSFQWNAHFHIKYHENLAFIEQSDILIETLRRLWSYYDDNFRYV